MAPTCVSSDEIVASIQPTCGYNSCEGCRLRSVDVYALLRDEKELFKFFFLHGVVPCHIVCSKCQRAVRYTGSARSFVCCRLNKKSKKPCRKKGCITGITGRTLACWFNIIREIFIFWAIWNSEVIGGEDVIVEIEESKIEKRKESRGRSLVGEWIVGGIEKNTQRFFLVAREENSAATLAATIKQRIRPGTTVYSNCWNCCDRFGDQYYQDLTKDHLINFVDTTMKPNHLSLEKMWEKVRKKVPGPKRKTEQLQGYLSECLFMIKHTSCSDRFHAFWKAVGAF